MIRINLNIIINYIIGIYLACWIFYASLNWDVFSVKLNTNVGFSVVGGYPFAFFFLFGFAVLLLLKYFIHIKMIRIKNSEVDRNHQISILKKDVELLKMRELVLKSQTSEKAKNSSPQNDQNKKADEISVKKSEVDESAKKPDNPAQESQ